MGRSQGSCQALPGPDSSKTDSLQDVVKPTSHISDTSGGKKNQQKKPKKTTKNKQKDHKKNPKTKKPHKTKQQQTNKKYLHWEREGGNKKKETAEGMSRPGEEVVIDGRPHIHTAAHRGPPHTGADTC